jgi:hypothetical protein
MFERTEKSIVRIILTMQNNFNGGRNMKKALGLSVILLVLTFIISGCSKDSGVTSASAQQQNIVEDEYLLFISYEDNEYLGDLYFKKETGEKEKLSSDVQKDTFYFLALEESVIFLDKENNLYLKEKGKEKELITSEANYNYNFFANESGIIFIKGDDRDLYIKELNKEKEKIASDVDFYNFTTDGKIIYFTNSEGDLYVKKSGEEKVKIASNSSYFYMSEDGNIIYYLSSDSNLYVRNLTEPDNRKLTSGEIMDIIVSSDGKMITYLNEYNYDKGKGELYFINDGDTPKKIASDVTSYQLCNDGGLVYYLNEENNLLAVIPGKEEKNKISGDILSFSSSNKGDIVVLENVDGNIYIQDNNKEKEKIGDDINKWDKINNSFVFLTEDKELYLKEFGKEKEKLAVDIQNYTVSEFDKSLTYYNINSELYLKVLGKDPVKILDNIRDFSAVYFSNRTLFENKLRLEDIRGIWAGLYNEKKLFFEITDDYKFKVYLNGQLQSENGVSIEDATLTSGTLVLEDGPTSNLDMGDYLYIKNFKENELTLLDIKFTKIDKTEFQTKLEEQKKDYEEQQKVLAEKQKVLEEQAASQNKIDEAHNIADEISYTYQVVSVSNADLLEIPWVDSEPIATLNPGAEFFIDDTYVDDSGKIWCYFEVCDQYDNYYSGWTEYSNFE